MKLLVIDGALTDPERVVAFSYVTDEADAILTDENDRPLRDEAA